MQNIRVVVFLVHLKQVGVVLQEFVHGLEKVKDRMFFWKVKDRMFTTTMSVSRSKIPCD